MKHINVALFVVHKGCPHMCSFCNQRSISGSQKDITAADVHEAAATAIASWAVREAAHQAQSEGAPSVVGRVVLKEWVTGDNARESHAAMNGERVPIDADFSNGQ